MGQPWVGFIPRQLNKALPPACLRAIQQPELGRHPFHGPGVLEGPLKRGHVHPCMHVQGCTCIVSTPSLTLIRPYCVQVFWTRDVLWIGTPDSSRNETESASPGDFLLDGR